MARLSRSYRLLAIAAAALAGPSIAQTAISDCHIGIKLCSGVVGPLHDRKYPDAALKATQQRRKALINQHTLNRVKKAKNAAKHLKGKAGTYRLK